MYTLENKLAVAVVTSGGTFGAGTEVRIISIGDITCQIQIGNHIFFTNTTNLVKMIHPH
jgi:hypothetical protein